MLRFDCPNVCMKYFTSPPPAGPLNCMDIPTFPAPAAKEPGRSVARAMASCSSSASSMRTNLRAKYLV